AGALLRPAEPRRPRSRARGAGRGRCRRPRAPPAARSLGRPAPARADRARDRQPRSAVRAGRADVGAGHRRRAAGHGADRRAARAPRRRGRDGDPPGRGRAGARRPRVAARPRPRRRAVGHRRRDARQRRLLAHLRPRAGPRRGQARGHTMTDSTSWHELFANLPIFKDAIITGGLAGALLGFIGVHVVLRRMVFASSAIAQAAALGVALSFWMPIIIDPVRHAAGHQAGSDVHLVSSLLFEPVLWAIAASLLATLVFIANPLRLHLTRESLLGLVFLVSGAGAVIVGDRITQEAHDLSAILFGSAVVVQPADLMLVSAATVVLLFGHLLCWRAMIFVGYDPIGARVQELPVRRLNTFLFLSIGIAVALATRALGALPVFAFSVLPAMAALALTSRMSAVFALATLFGALSGVAGYAISFRGELPVGATQTALAAAFVGAAMLARFLVRVLRRNGHA